MHYFPNVRISGSSSLNFV